jgi:HPt (histidine-containing phosphotransfer) domain-containing protein
VEAWTVQRMSVQLDLRRIAELQGLMGTELGEIIASLVQSMSRAIEQLEAALAAGELERAAYAAHQARNDALMVGAAELQRSLADVEATSRESRLELARENMKRLREIWPITRDQLERAADEPDGA